MLLRVLQRGQWSSHAAACVAAGAGVVAMTAPPAERQPHAETSDQPGAALLAASEPARRGPWATFSSAASSLFLPMAHADAAAASGSGPDALLIAAMQADPSAASVVLLTAPISSMMHSTRISDQALAAAAQTLEARGLHSLAAWELTSASFGLATLGCPLGDSLRQALAASVTSPASLPLAHVAIRAWALAVDGAMTQQLWEEVCTAIYRKYSVKEFDGVSNLFLMHAAMLVASGAASMEPRATRAEVESAFKPLARKAAKKVLEVYDSLIPINPCVLSHMLSVGLAISVLPDLDQASSSSSPSAAASASSAAGGPAGGGALKERLLPAVVAAAGPAGCQAVARAAAQPHELARVRRDLDCLVRDGDEARQKVLNEVTFLCAMRLPALGPVLTANDLDLLLPKARMVLRVSVPSSSSTFLSEPAVAFSPEGGIQALRSLVSSHFRPGGGARTQSCQGVERSALSGAQRGGWRTATLDSDVWRAAKSEGDKIRMLQQLLGL